MQRYWILLFALGLFWHACPAQHELTTALDKRAEVIAPQVIEWRRYIHQHPELSNREVETGKYVAARLRELGLQVNYPVAGNGVVALLKGGKPGPVVALRADMDALPVTEQVDLPFKSTVKSTYENQPVGVMHACGHDAHTAILLGVAQLLSEQKNQLAGTVKFFFQPSEEGAPLNEAPWGAEKMIQEGVMENPKVEAVFGLHVGSNLPTGIIGYREGPAMASTDWLNITLHGKQSHGAQPWNGIDPNVVAAQVLLGLQTIVSRQMDIVQEPVVITIGSLHGGVRNNIIPDSTTMSGTIRSFNEEMREDVKARIRRTVDHIAQSAGATATTTITKGYPVTRNDSTLTERMLPSLRQVAGASNVRIVSKRTGAEDFSRFQQVAPGLFFYLGVSDPALGDAENAPTNHSPLFRVDERALVVGVKAFCHLVVDYTGGTAGKGNK